MIQAALYRTLNPANGELVENYQTATDRDVEAAVESAARAFALWRETPIEQRAQLVRRAGELLETDAAEMGALMALEMGKPIAQGDAEAKKCAWACRWYADNAASFLAAQPRESDGSAAFVRHDPLGPILAIMPWNFPFWQFFRFAAPSLMAGNVILLKHAPNTPGCGLRIEKLMDDAGFPPGVVRNLFLSNDQAARVIGDARVRGVTLTGSTRAGRAVAAIAGHHLKTMVMELGGSDAFIVLADADVDRAAEVGVTARCLNTGQSCIAAKRFIVDRAVFPRFRDAFVDGMRARVPGNPRDPKTTLGPMARQDLRDQLASQVERSVAGGAEAILGGKTPDTPGYFYPATVLQGARPGTPAADEELFGPAASLVSVANEEEALAVANGTGYGLGASLWTADRARADRLIPQDRHRLGLRERTGEVRPQTTVRRREGVGLRPRAGTRRPARVREREDRLDRLTHDA